MAAEEQAAVGRSRWREEVRNMEKRLEELVRRLKDTAGENLQSLVLYGSAATGEFQPGYSNLNILCLLHRAGTGDLEALQPAVAWWVRQRRAAPIVLTLDELLRSADIFAIELLDIQTNHRMLYGENVFSDIGIPRQAYQWCVERELRANWLRLRQAILTAPPSNRALLGLMSSSVGTFTALFRHALLAIGAPPAKNRREAVSRVAELVGGDASAFFAVLDVRDAKKKASDLDVEAALHAYLELVTLAADEVDRRLMSEHR